MSDERIPLDFIPADTLFCRDQRPLAAGSGHGHGAHWPLPTVLHSAIRTALLRAAGDLPTKKKAGFKRYGETHREFGSSLFNWLNIHGPFPVKCYEGGKEQIYFPRPLDLVPKPEERKDQEDNTDTKDSETTDPVPVSAMRLIGANGGNWNLPAPLQFAVASSEPPTKANLADWIPLDCYNAYLAGGDGLAIKPLRIWDTEHRIGVELVPDTGTAADGKLYAAEHLRLRPDIRLRFSCSHPPTHKPLDPAEAGHLPDSLPGTTIHLGGEGRFGLIEKGGDFDLPSATVAGRLVKWVLLTPAIFAGGWLPGWIDPATGAVLLRSVEKGNRAEFRRMRREAEGKSDAASRKEHDAGTEGVAATLVAACVGKPQIVGGWDLLGDAVSGTPKATHLAVPSGSVYYFEADSESDATRLAALLQGRCRSDMFGEKGLGLGVCGTWQPPAGKGGTR